MKLVYLFKRIKLKNEYNNNVNEINQVLKRIKILESNYDYVDNNIQTYYDYELILLRSKYQKIIKSLKVIDKDIQKI